MAACGFGGATAVAAEAAPANSKAAEKISALDFNVIERLSKIGLMLASVTAQYAYPLKTVQATYPAGVPTMSSTNVVYMKIRKYRYVNTILGTYYCSSRSLLII
jgi:hypothetical protein